MTLRSHRQISVDDYHKMAEVGILGPDEHVELIEGEIIKMSPIKSYHAGTVNHLVELLAVSLSGKAVLCVQNPIQLNKHSEPEPDLVIAHYQKDRFKDRHPNPEEIHLIIEVADSSLEYDRIVKTPLYAEVGIPEYWIINLQDKQVEVHQYPVHGEFTVRRILFPTDKLTLEALDISITLSELFA